MSVCKFSLVLVVIICISFSIVSVNALNSKEWTYQYVFGNPSNLYYPGENTYVIITFYSNTNEQLRISYVGVAFDWAPNTYYAANLTSNPVQLAADGAYTFNPISFSIPSDVSVSGHGLTILFNGQKQGQAGWSNFSVTGTGEIYVVITDEQEEYNQKAQSLSSSLSLAADSNYQARALAFLQQAYDAYNQATHLANLGQWQAAINELNTTANYLSQAQIAEVEYSQSPTPSPAVPEFSILVILSFFISVLIVAVCLTQRRD
jgi:hypothetical protein